VRCGPSWDLPWYLLTTVRWCEARALDPGAFAFTMAAISYDVDPVPNRKCLLDMLAAHRTHDADERDHLARMLALLEVSDDPFTRAQFVPGHFTASAFVVAPSNDALLLIQHPKLGRWLQPGGHVEPCDTDLLAAARREVYEEVGLRDLPTAVDGVFDLDVHHIPPLGREPAHEHFDVRFAFLAPDRDLRVGEDTEAKVARWFSLPELEAGASDASVLRAARKLVPR
jgi:8-oxo-dGTP pyrophosphatase MutT (NUDIX family)